MNIEVNTSSGWENAVPDVKVGSTWEPVKEIHAKTGGSWTRVYDTAFTMEIDTRLYYSNSSNTYFWFYLGDDHPNPDYKQNDQSHDVQIDWGDGNITNSVYGPGIPGNGRIEHNYATPGTYIVRVTGSATTWGTDGELWGNQMLRRVLSFGEIGLTTFSLSLMLAENLVSLPRHLPKRSNITTMYWLTGHQYTELSPNLGWDTWDTSTVTSMEKLFDGHQYGIDGIENWDVSNVTNFERAFAFTPVANPDISSWDTSSATNMQRMFQTARAFNQDIGSWDTSSVTGTGMDVMFWGASSFNQDLSGWCVSNIPTAPSYFDDNATAWTLPRPVWGTCP